MSSVAITIKSLSTFSASLAEVSTKYMLCLFAKSSPTAVGISLSSLSVLLPVKNYKINNFFKIKTLLLPTNKHP